MKRTKPFPKHRKLTRQPSLPPGLDAYRVLAPAETAALIGVSTDTLLRMDARGEGPPRIRISPRRVGYRLRDCEAWLNAQSGEG